MKVLLVDLPYVVKPTADGPKIRSFHAFPYGLLSIATYNKDCADIRIFDMNRQSEHDFLHTLREFRPDIVGFSMMFDNSYKYLKDLLYVSHCHGATTILGGAAACYSYSENLMEQPYLDAICFAEGEIPLRRILTQETTFITDPSWITRNKSGIPVSSFVQNLDDVINIDYNFVNVNAYDMKEAFSPFGTPTKHKQFFVSTGRGCPFKCTFCSNSKIHGQKMRFASVNSIINHIGHLVEKYGMDVLTIYDDQLLINRGRAKSLFKELAQFNLRIECPNGLSVAFIDDELACLMKRAGLDTTYLAIESGSEYVLNKLIQKPLKLEMVKPAIEILRNYDFFIHGFFVMGMPGETSEHRQETYKFIKDIDLDWAGLNMATPVRGSKLYDDCLYNGWIKKQEISDIVDKAYIITANGDPKKIEEEVYLENIEINFHHNRRMRIGDYKVAQKCFEEVLRRYHGHVWAKHYIQECKKRLSNP